MIGKAMTRAICKTFFPLIDCLGPNARAASRHPTFYLRRRLNFRQGGMGWDEANIKELARETRLAYVSRGVIGLSLAF